MREETLIALLLVFIFESMCSWACIGMGGGGGRVCCPIAAPICAPAVPICSNEGFGSYNNHGSYGGGGSYSAPIVVNCGSNHGSPCPSYPRPFGYSYPGPSYSSYGGSGYQPCGNSYGHDNSPCPSIEIQEQQQQSSQQLFPNFQQETHQQPCNQGAGAGGSPPCPSVSIQAPPPCPSCPFDKNNNNHVDQTQTNYVSGDRGGGGGHSCRDSSGGGCGESAEVEAIRPAESHGHASAQTNQGTHQGKTPACEEASCHSFGPVVQLPSSGGALPSPLPFAQIQTQPQIAPAIQVQTQPEPPPAPPIPPHLPLPPVEAPSPDLPPPSPEPIPPGPELESTYDEPETPQTPLPAAPPGSPEPPAQPPLIPTQTEVAPASPETLAPEAQTEDYFEQSTAPAATLPPLPPPDASPPAPPLAQNPYEAVNEVFSVTVAQPVAQPGANTAVLEYGEETPVQAEEAGEALTCDDVDLRKIVETALKSSSDNLEAARRIEGDAAAKFGGRFNSIVSNNEFAYVNWYGKRNCQLRVNNRHSLTWED